MSPSNSSNGSPLPDLTLTAAIAEKIKTAIEHLAGNRKLADQFGNRA
jgi:hypothetical protein